MATSMHTKLLGIIGTPVEHTLSPKMHSFIAERAGMDTAYLAFDVQPEHLGEVLSAMAHAGALGFNITAPHKIAVMDYLSEVDPAAALMGTVNTVVNHDGRWIGYNTDGEGFVGSLEFDHGPVAGKDVLLLGAGGSARSVAYLFAKKGARSITVTGRTPEKVRQILDVIDAHTDAKTSDDMDNLPGYDFIVNTTPLGMHPLERENPFARYDLAHEGSVLCDLIYNPKETVFLQEAKRRGLPIVNGLGMLVLQGIYSYMHFTGAQLDVMPLYRDLLALLDEYRIV